jgi:hypothetical protein
VSHKFEKAKKASSGLHGDWVQRSLVEVQPEDDFEALRDVQVPCDEQSLTSWSRPQTSLPDSDDDREGGLSDDAGETAAELRNLSGKPLRPKTLRNRHCGGGSKTNLS